MTTKLPLDTNDNVIPALRLKDGGAHKINVNISSARNAAAFDSETRVVSLYATVPVFLKFGDATATATTSDHYFPAGLYYDVAIGGDGTGHFTHVAALRESLDGVLYISEKH